MNRFFLLCCLLLPASASAQCVSIDGPKSAIEKKHGSWTVLTGPQWQFIRGIFAMNPLTPPGLPFGDSAALAKFEGNEGGVVFFIDGDQACTPMPVPKTLIEMLDDVASGKVTHEGAGL
jgi:hypothetical protein